jgi:hypothetical protein
MLRRSPGSRTTEAGSDSADSSGPRPGAGLSRRKVFTGAVGAAAATATAGALLSETASPALAAGGRTMLARRGVALAALQGTTVESGAVAPAVVVLTDAATIALDASRGNDFRVTIAGDRTISNPSNPTDGQKIVLQVTQGSGGSWALTWGSAYQFSDGLPQPVLSTKAGDTDLLAFIYNQAQQKWLLVAFVNGFASTVVPPPKGTYRLFPSTNGPSSPVSFSGPFMAGIQFQVTTGGVWFDGFWWWVCPTGQSTAPQTFALWNVFNDNGAGNLIPGATATSGTLTAGQWNFVPLKNPIPLAVGACYNACTGFSGSFPDTTNQFGGGQPYQGGITNGPLMAFSDQTGSNPVPFSLPQGVFSVAGSDPTAFMPENGNKSDNLWIDLQVETNAPAGTSYRLWPSYPTLPGAAQSGPVPYTLATEFQLSQACTLDNIWFYSGAGAGDLPTRCGIWNVSSQSVVSGTDKTSPSWSGAAGSGWVACSYSGVTLPAGDYKVAAYYGGQNKWFQFVTGYWANGGPGAAGISTGPLTAPNVANATSPGQSTYGEGSWTYPQTYGAAGNGENYWIDVEVTPS